MNQPTPAPSCVRCGHDRAFHAGTHGCRLRRCACAVFEAAPQPDDLDALARVIS